MHVQKLKTKPEVAIKNTLLRGKRENLFQPVVGQNKHYFFGYRARKPLFANIQDSHVNSTKAIKEIMVVHSVITAG